MELKTGNRKTAPHSSQKGILFAVQDHRDGSDEISGKRYVPFGPAVADAAVSVRKSHSNCDNSPEIRAEIQTLPLSPTVLCLSVVHCCLHEKNE